MASPFTHLHVHSHYSLLTALPKIKHLITAAKKNGMDALALTDNGNMYGAIEFYKKCKDEGIKPIIGVDFYVAIRGRADKQAGVDNRRFRLVLLAKNFEGYQNLIKLVSRANLEGFYYKPRVDKELLKELSSGLICIIPSFASDVSQSLKSNDIDQAKERLYFYTDTYGKENCYLEITHHPEIEEHEGLTQKTIKFSNETGTPVVAAHDVYYIHPEDKKARETLLSIQSNVDFEKNGFNEDESDFSFVSSEQIAEFFKDIPEAIENTRKIADTCNLELELGKWVFPDLKIDSKKTYDEELRDVGKQEEWPHADSYHSAVTFLGSYHPADYRQRLAILMRIKDLGLQVWGNREWMNTPLRDCYRGPVTPDVSEIRRIYAASNIVIHSDANASNPHATGLTMRPFDVTAAGALLVAQDDRPEIDDMFSKGREYVSFHDELDVREKVDYYANHREARDEIARAGFYRTRSEHTYLDRMEAVLHTINETTTTKAV